MNTLVNTWRSLRRTAFEAVGSSKYSRPALHGLDQKLAAILNWKGGVFIEAGANDGFTQSNTYYLERFQGWTGVLVEPIPSLARKCRRLRRNAEVFNCALVSKESDGEEFEIIYGNLMSTISGSLGSQDAENKHIARAKEIDAESGTYRVKVKGRALSNLLDEAKIGAVDFLSLDVEGFELRVLEGVDWSRHAPKFILVESRDSAGMINRLTPQYVLHERLVVLPHREDLLFRRKSP